MRSDYLQNVRYKLQKRVRNLKAADPNQFLPTLKRFWVFFDTYPILKATVEELLARVPDYAGWVDTIWQGQQMITGETESEAAAIGYGVLKKYAVETKPREIRFLNLIPHRSGGIQEHLETFRDLYLEPFYEYVDEHLDDRNFVLATLIRYKHRCEWFRRTQLYGQWSKDTRRGEKLLALDLYEYLYEQGIEFHIEPASASGEADMVSSQTSNNPILADAKIFNPDAGKGVPYLRQGFQQIYLYSCDYNQSIGYLVIFNASPTQLRWDLQEPAEPIPRITFNNKTVFFLVIDVFPHEEPASKRKVVEPLTITEQEIVQALSSRGS